MADVEGLSHSAICVHDLREAEEFYCNVLGARLGNRVNFKTDDAIRGRSVHGSVILEDYLLALMVTRDFMPTPPAEQHRGAHGFRHAFRVTRARFDEITDELKRRRSPFEGPVEHPEKSPFGESIYFKDPSGNFLEIVWRRDEDVSYQKPYVTGVG
jgi:catechol-2,3-dioxygenase